jgi:hypothetical protein
MKKFLMGRVDLAIFQNWSAAFLMKSQNRTMDELEPLLLIDGSSNYYLAMSKNSDPALVKKYAKLLKRCSNQAYSTSCGSNICADITAAQAAD